MIDRLREHVSVVLSLALSFSLSPVASQTCYSGAPSPMSQGTVDKVFPDIKNIALLSYRILDLLLSVALQHKVHM